MKSDENWIQQYEDVERSRGNAPTGRSELRGRPIVDGKIVRIITTKDIA